MIIRTLTLVAIMAATPLAAQSYNPAYDQMRQEQARRDLLAAQQASTYGLMNALNANNAAVQNSLRQNNTDLQRQLEAQAQNQALRDIANALNRPRAVCRPYLPC